MNQTTTSNREPYEPPTIEAVPLHPQEQVLAACKSTNASGPSTATCVLSGCSAISPS